MAAMEKNPERRDRALLSRDVAEIVSYSQGAKKDCYGARSKIGIFHGTLDFKTGFHDTPLKPGS